MTKSELIALMAARSDSLKVADVERIVEVVIDKITEALTEGRRIELRGFGSFAVKERTARAARNPRTGEQVSVPARKSLNFKAGKRLRDDLNGESA